MNIKPSEVNAFFLGSTTVKGLALQAFIACYIGACRKNGDAWGKVTNDDLVAVADETRYAKVLSAIPTIFWDALRDPLFNVWFETERKNGVQRFSAKAGDAEIHHRSGGTEKTPSSLLGWLCDYVISDSGV
jgi:hypothetical protein